MQCGTLFSSFFLIIIIVLVLSVKSDYAPDMEEEEWRQYVPPQDQDEIVKEASISKDQGEFTSATSSIPFQTDLKGCIRDGDYPCGKFQPNFNLWEKIGDTALNRRISYKIREDIRDDPDMSLRRIIFEQLAIIERQTCLIFVQEEWSYERPDSDLSYGMILFMGTTEEFCYVDKQLTEKNEIGIHINVEDSCGIMKPKKNGIILHLVMLALGFPYEHVRHDRDQHLKIFTKNIIPGREDDFAKHPKNVHLDYPYDYDSIMHPHYEFLQLNKWRPTITPNKRDPAVSIGQRQNLSRTDVKKLNRYFCFFKLQDESQVTCPTLPPIRRVTVETSWDTSTTTLTRTKTSLTFITRTMWLTSTVTTTEQVTALPRFATVTDEDNFGNYEKMTPSWQLPKPTKPRWKTTTTESETDNDNDNNEETPAPLTFETQLRTTTTFEPNDDEDTTAPFQGGSNSKIRPSKTIRCPSNLVMVSNWQTITQTTIWSTDYGYGPLAVTKATNYRKQTNIWTSKGHVNNYDVLLTPIPSRSAITDFERLVTAVSTYFINAQTLELQSFYRDSILDNGARLIQQKSETRVWKCWI